MCDLIKFVTIDRIGAWPLCASWNDEWVEGSEEGAPLEPGKWIMKEGFGVIWGLEGGHAAASS